MCERVSVTLLYERAEREREHEQLTCVSREQGASGTAWKLALKPLKTPKIFALAAGLCLRRRLRRALNFSVYTVTGGGRPELEPHRCLNVEYREKSDVRAVIVVFST